MHAPIRRPHALSALAAAAFVASRLWLLFAYSPQYSDMDVYRHYAALDAVAARTGQSLWQATATGWQQAARNAERLGRAAPLPETRIVEYPPLGLLPIVVAARIAPPAEPRATWPARYARTFRAELFVVDVLAFLLLWLVARVPPWALAIYIAGGLSLCDFLYDRLDLVLGALVAAALVLLVGRRRVAWAWLVLALAIAYKLVPLALVPVFAVGALAPEAIAPGRGLVRAGVVRLVANGALGVALAAIALLLPSLRWGTATLSFLDYHRARGLQIESPLASLVMLLARATGEPYAVQRHFGANELVAPAAAELAASSTLLVALATLIATLWLVRALATQPAGGEGTRLAQRHPQLFVDGALLTLLLTMSVSKVLSPQYLVWLVPLVPLVRRAGFGLAFVAVAALTTLICPHLYPTQILRLFPDVSPPAGLGPTGLGLALLVARNAALAALAVWLARRMPHRHSAPLA